MSCPSNRGYSLLYTKLIIFSQFLLKMHCILFKFFFLSIIYARLALKRGILTLFKQLSVPA